MEQFIMLVEDNPDDEELMLRAFKHSHLKNEIVVVRDGQEAVDYLFGTGSYAGRDPNILPEVVLLDINLPKINGLEVLRRIRANPQTSLLPVVMLTSSTEDRDRMTAYGHHANSYIRKPVAFDQFTKAVQQLGLYWLVLNKAAPKPG